MTWTLDGSEPEATDLRSDPSPIEVATPEVRQRSRLLRPRNLIIVLVIVAIVVGYFTVVRRPTSPSRSAMTASGTPTAAVLADTNADVVSFRQSDYHPGFTLPVGSPALEERGWALGNGRVSVTDYV